MDDDPPVGFLGRLRSVWWLVSALFVCSGGLVTATVRLSQYDNRVAALELAAAERDKSMADATAERKQIQVEFAANQRDREERRLLFANEFSSMGQRIALLEQQELKTDTAASDTSRGLALMDQKGSIAFQNMVRDVDQRLASLDRRAALLEQQNAFIGEYLRGVLLPVTPRR